MIKPFGLKRGDTVGIFTPSSPGYALNAGLFENGIRNIEKLGFKVKLGSVTAARKSQGAPFNYEELIQEVVGPRPYPIVSNFDCGHTTPMITIHRYATIRLTATDQAVRLNILDGSIAERKS